MLSCLFWSVGFKVINSRFCPCVEPNCKLNNASGNDIKLDRKGVYFINTVKTLKTEYHKKKMHLCHLAVKTGLILKGFHF